MRVRALVVLAALAQALPVVGAVRAEPTATEIEFLHGRIDGRGLLDAMCTDVDRRSTGAICEDDPIHVVRGLERARCAHWMMLGPEAVWAALRRDAVSFEFAKAMHDSCLNADRIVGD